jgi:hypothetical protein
MRIRPMFSMQRMAPLMQRAERHLTSRALGRRRSLAQLTLLLLEVWGSDEGRL